MRVSSTADYGWQRVKSVRGINVTDHTYLDQEQNGEIHQKVSALMSQDLIGRKKCFNSITVTAVLMPAGTSFFMHFSTEGRNEGNAARLESKTVTPMRDCKVQCLQFYYYHSGNETDQLNIWIREQQNEADSRGALRLMDQITGPELDTLHNICDPGPQNQS